MGQVQGNPRRRGYGPAITEIASTHPRGGRRLTAIPLSSSHGNWVGIDLGLSWENGNWTGFPWHARSFWLLLAGADQVALSPGQPVSPEEGWI